MRCLSTFIQLISLGKRRNEEISRKALVRAHLNQFYGIFFQTFSGLEQYAIKKFAEALEVFPKVLAETSGAKGNEIISQLYASHNDGNKNSGFDIEVLYC